MNVMGVSENKVLNLAFKGHFIKPGRPREIRVRKNKRFQSLGHSSMNLTALLGRNASNNCKSASSGKECREMLLL